MEAVEHMSTEKDRELELEPLQRQQNHGDSASDSSAGISGQPLGSSPLGGGRGGNRQLRKQPSWFRVPSFKDVRGGIQRASSHIGLSEIIDASRGGGSHSIGGTARYLWAQSKAAMRPLVMLHFLKLALPGGLMMAFEAGSFDFNTAMAGYLGSPVITAAHSAMFAFIYLTYTTFPFAIATASTIRYVQTLTCEDISIDIKTHQMSISDVCLRPVHPFRTNCQALALHYWPIK